jgi:hypothetical protein
LDTHPLVITKTINGQNYSCIPPIKKNSKEIVRHTYLIQP